MGRGDAGFLFFSFGEKNQKNLNGVLLLGAYAVVMSASFEVLATVNHSDILDL